MDFNQTEYEHLNETIKDQYEYFAERTWKKERANFCLKVVGTSGKEVWSLEFNRFNIDFEHFR